MPSISWSLTVTICVACRSKREKRRSRRRNPGAIRLSEHISADGPEVFAHACRLGAEGIVSKRLGSPYRSGLCDAWIKCKNPLECAVNPALQLR
jgi:ATP-dependent DNA ligase